MNEEDREEKTEDPRSHLYEIADWFSKSKNTLLDRAERHGEAEELMRIVGDNWPSIEAAMRVIDPEIPINYSQYTSGSGHWFRSHDPTDPSDWWHEDPTIRSEFLISTGTATALSGAWIGHVSAPPILNQIFDRPAKEKETGDLVSSALRNLSLDVAAKFERAWQNWYTSAGSSTFDALLAMREAVDHTIKYLSERGQPFQGSLSEQRKKRVEWIVTNRVTDPMKRVGLVNASEICQRLYSRLSRYGKKRRPVPPDVARESLIQAQNFLRLLLDACGLTNWREQ